MQTLVSDPNDPPKTPKTGEIRVRPSTEADAPAMIAIYSRHVTQGLTGMSFEPNVCLGGFLHYSVELRF